MSPTRATADIPSSIASPTLSRVGISSDDRAHIGDDLQHKEDPQRPPRPRLGVEEVQHEDDERQPPKRRPHDPEALARDVVLELRLDLLDVADTGLVSPPSILVLHCYQRREAGGDGDGADHEVVA
ncbi:hypothetical protein VP1G_10530 [Cytospora mali]|uniref:Uncharacterized protein n=1 Tax=Cytospora mali TaxID=578113 RepID=A0A194UN08_CYTMA|nr:hypothetical protein VP1G_10530 [Valsa mali var. pyri (nom. inval.)]